MTVVDDLVVLDLDPRFQLVRLTEEVGAVHRLEVVDPVRGRIVVVGDAERERQLRQPFDRLGRNPGNGSDGRVDPHGCPFREV